MLTAVVFVVFLEIFSKIYCSKELNFRKCRQVNSSDLNIHLIPHSHDDVGWVYTVDEYYEGSIHHAIVKDILTSTIEALQKNPKRRFVQAESYFFNRWWNTRTEAEKQQVKNLVSNGQLEFVGGAWSQNDEATTHYQSIIDQFTLGLRMLNETFGEGARPNAAWQIDCFGHSRETASLLAQMGYKSLFFGRLDHRDKKRRLDAKNAEFVWRGSPSLGKSSEIFTSVLYNLYHPPEGFCFDFYCANEMNKKRGHNVFKAQILHFYWQMLMQSFHYKTSNILITMGGDFHFSKAEKNFINMDKLIEASEQYPVTFTGQSIKVFYSTPACYAEAVSEETKNKNLKHSLETDDFFPYSHKSGTYWTGYYTSRPTLKRFEREGNNFLQVAKQISAMTGSAINNLESLQEAMGILQHHDAITGTEKEYVANDYSKILTMAMEETSKATNSLLNKLLSKTKDKSQIDFKLSLLRNVSYCLECKESNFVVAVHNPLSRFVSNYVHLPVDFTDFTILDPDGKKLEYQVSKVPKDFSYTTLKVSPFTLVFFAEKLPPLGLKLYRITRNGKSKNCCTKENKATVVGKEDLQINLNPKTGKISSITINGKTVLVEQDLMYYSGSSGAYVFRSSFNDIQKVAENVDYTIYKGELFDEVQQIYSNWTMQVIRIYKKAPYVEFEWIVGPLEITNYWSKEVVSRFTTDINSGKNFFTDSNGRETIKRKRNHLIDEPIAGNYYPVPTRITIKDKHNLTFAIVTDRSQGGSSLKSGQLELMIHRATAQDDHLGVSENLEETQFGQGIIVRGRHFVTFGKGNKFNARVKGLVQEKVLEPWVFVAKIPEMKSLENNFNFQYSGLKRELPENVHLLTLEPLQEGQILLRLEHLFEVNEDEELSKKVDVDLKDLFTHFQIIKLRETNLAANVWLSVQDNLKVTLKPMQIRTFIADVNFYK